VSHQLLDIFTNEITIKKIKARLPYLFQIAEIESSRAGKIGMQVGSVRENIVVALLAHIFGTENIDTEIPITEPETDAVLFGKPLSIKTITGTLGGVKLIWTVDSQKAREFFTDYYPSCDVLLVQIIWGATGAFYYIPKEVQIDVFNTIGRERYLKLPKQGTNPRGVEITEEALTRAIRDNRARTIPISWEKREVKFNLYERWIKLWEENSE
jgi:hypothetical protein